jgi:tRNA(fMet)-specific endonuclease VapC
MEDMRVIIEVFIPPFSIIPIYNSLDIYAKEKAKLRKQCLLIDDFNILIGATAITHDMVLKTNNVAHLSRIDNIIIEDSTKQSKI